MYIQEIKNNEIRVAIPLTKGTDRTRIKRRRILNEYGIPVSTKSEPFDQSCYVEWQIGYDVVTLEKEKLDKTTLKNLRFIGANGKEKALYELSEYIKYFYDWKIVSEDELINIRKYLQSMTSDAFLDNSIGHPELAIKRTNFVQKEINGFNLVLYSTLPPSSGLSSSAALELLIIKMLNDRYNLGLDDIELVVVGGESDVNARPFNYDWVLNIREQCIRKNVDFEFRQCGTYTIKDGKQYKIQTKDLCKQAKLANIDYKN